MSGHLTYRHLTYTGVCRSYVRFVQKKQTYDLQTPVILVMNSVGVMSICEVLSRLKSLRYAFKKKKRHYLGNFPNMGGGLPKSQNFCKFTKYFFVCQIHSEVLKHVLQMGG